jgi:S1-C subfamily serine protease
LLDDSGRITSIVFQPSDQAKTGYAIPAEAVHRVQRDILKDGQLVRGWLGLALLPENADPKIVRVIPDSPASKAGIRAGDVLISIGSRRISDYADAANAFFYLIPGQAVGIRMKRGATPLTYSLTPSRPQSGR